MIRYFQYFVGQFCCFDHLTGILNGSFLNGLQNNSVVERAIEQIIWKECLNLINVHYKCKSYEETTMCSS
ncbi:uncharacterized protein OCT59_013452 [Rhizophagus irregularis]|uniref:uncharacterized protein n=1 Tax=Rhizophagus irregularis TaxID=588596 RepID=UPI00332A5B9D|nr:hypothetical protein OCT59_013452 [Rhizophagus irregularis]